MAAAAADGAGGGVGCGPGAAVMRRQGVGRRQLDETDRTEGPSRTTPAVNFRTVSCRQRRDSNRFAPRKPPHSSGAVPLRAIDGGKTNGRLRASPQPSRCGWWKGVVAVWLPPQGWGAGLSVLSGLRGGVRRRLGRRRGTEAESSGPVRRDLRCRRLPLSLVAAGARPAAAAGRGGCPRCPAGTASLPHVCPLACRCLPAPLPAEVAWPPRAPGWAAGADPSGRSGGATRRMSRAGSPVKTYDFLLKFLLVGDSEVGKGEILASLRDGSPESPYGYSTVLSLQDLCCRAIVSCTLCILLRSSLSLLPQEAISNLSPWQMALMPG
ncbi:ras-related protein Rab-40B [Calypte anna]|uniref:ras-related protein Rab-40B n=1 Tax=Calypte anna TaxID=9244 RepID=UPI0011C469E3|nr:ras-related protein Rab-40B [Calypte anna]